MSAFGRKLIRSLEQFRDDLRANKPMKQTIVRRMKVKGKTVFTHETFTAPIRPTPKG
jgi:hypothetical protein